MLDSVELGDWDAIIQVAQNTAYAVADDGTREAFAQIGVKASEDQNATLNTKSLSATEYRAAELVGKKYIRGVLVDNPSAQWAITTATRDMLRIDVELAYDQGWSAKQLSEKLEQSYAFSAVRASTIARTELMRADSAAGIRAYRESGVVFKKEWSPDAEACPICITNADQGIIGIDELFESGDDTSPAHPNCECSVNPVVDEII